MSSLDNVRSDARLLFAQLPERSEAGTIRRTREALRAFESDGNVDRLVSRVNRESLRMHNRLSSHKGQADKRDCWHYIRNFVTLVASRDKGLRGTALQLADKLSGELRQQRGSSSVADVIDILRAYGRNNRLIGPYSSARAIAKLWPKYERIVRRRDQGKSLEAKATAVIAVGILLVKLGKPRKDIEDLLKREGISQDFIDMIFPPTRREDGKSPDSAALPKSSLGYGALSAIPQISPPQRSFSLPEAKVAAAPHSPLLFGQNQGKVAFLSADNSRRCRSLRKATSKLKMPIDKEDPMRIGVFSLGIIFTSQVRTK